MKHNTEFAKAVEYFFSKYLPHLKGLRKNTIISYSEMFKLYFRFNYEKNNIHPENMSIENFNTLVIIDFLDFLEIERHVSTRTRNQRLASIHTFTKYLQFEYPEKMLQWQKILMIPHKSYTPKRIEALSVDDITNFFKIVNLFGSERDKTMLEFLYDTGMRVQELIDFKRGDVIWGKTPKVIICGKGGKVRETPLLKATVKLLKTYLGDEEVPRLDETVFLNRFGNPLSRSGILRIIEKYVNIIREKDKLFPEKVTPHMFRHSKATHLLKSGCSEVSIQRLLGHADIQTTAIYAQADTEMVREGLSKININFETKSKEKKDWQKNSKLMNYLNNL